MDGPRPYKRRPVHSSWFPFSPSTLPPADLNTQVKMSFAASSENAWLEDGHILHAQCKNIQGTLVDSTIDLDHHIGNSDGKLHK